MSTAGRATSSRSPVSPTILTVRSSRPAPSFACSRRLALVVADLSLRLPSPLAHLCGDCLPWEPSRVRLEPHVFLCDPARGQGRRRGRDRHRRPALHLPLVGAPVLPPRLAQRLAPVRRQGLQGRRQVEAVGPHPQKRPRHGRKDLRRRPVWRRTNRLLRPRQRRRR